MKIVMFQYNRNVSAIYRHNTTSNINATGSKQFVNNRFLANGYEDRFLWEEAAFLHPKKTLEFAIPGNWQ